MIFGDLAVDMLQESASKVWNVAGMSIDRGRGTGPEEMGVHRNAEGEACGLNDGKLDCGIGHALAGVGPEPERSRDRSQQVAVRRKSASFLRWAILRLAGFDLSPRVDCGQARAMHLEIDFDDRIEIFGYTELVGAAVFSLLAIKHYPPSRSDSAKTRLQFQRSKVSLI